MTSHRKITARLLAGTALALLVGAATAPAAYAEENADDNYDQPLRLMKAKLKQKFPNRPAVIVTSSDGQTFTDARLRLGNLSPWRMSAEYKCPSGGYTPNGNYMLAPAQLKELRFEGSWFQELEETQGLLDSNSGEVDLFYWNDASQSQQAEITEIALNACNNKASQLRAASPGMSAKTAMSKVGTIYPFRSADRRFMTGVGAKLKGKCLAGRYERNTSNPGIYDNFSGFESSDTGELSVSLELPVNCSAKVTPPEPASASLTAGFTITAVALEAQPKLVAGVCPRTVKFNGRISGQGAGTVRYRIRGSDGSLSPIRSVRVRSGLEPGDIAFEHTFGEDSTGGLTTPPPGSSDAPRGLSIQGPRPDPSGPSFETTAPPPSDPPSRAGASSLAGAKAEGEHSGWYRIESVAPQSAVSKSDEANYKVICQEPEPGLSATPPSEPPSERSFRSNN